MLPPIRDLLARLYLLPLVVALLLLLLGGVGYLVASGKRKPVPVGLEVPGVWATDVNDSGPGGALLGAKVPSNPFEKQKKPPCSPRRERSIHGGCWLHLAARAPCPEGTYEHDGACFVPVLAARDVPVSGQRSPMKE